MRTTLTLDDDLAREIKEKAHRERKSFKEVVNETLRNGLGSVGRTAVTKAFLVEPNESGFVPGVDPGRLNQLLDAMDVSSFAGDHQK